MGNACFVTARDKTVVPNTSAAENFGRNSVRYSPDWSFQRDCRRRVAGEETSLSWLSDGIRRNDESDVKSQSAFVSSQGSPLDNFQTQSWQKSPASDQSFSRNVSIDTISEQITQQTNYSTELGSFPSPTKVSISLVSQPSSFSSKSPLQMPPTSSSTLKLTPRPHLTKQVSDGQIFEFTSPSRNSASEERCLGVRQHKLYRNGNRNSNGQQTCGACSRSLSEKSLLSSEKIYATNELPITAILACGHVYHSECLEQMTPEIYKFDPPCPICTLGKKKTIKLSEKALKADLDLKAKHNKRVRNRVMDSDDFAMFDHNHKAVAGGAEYKGKVAKLVSSSSLRSYSPKPFLAKHFSFGSRSNNTIKSPKETSLRKKGFFWTKYSKL